MIRRLVFAFFFLSPVVLLHFAFATGPVGWIDRLWQLSVLATVLLFVGCTLAPQYLVSLQSMPWAFQPRYNLELEFQALTYETYHGNWWSRGTHYALVPEQVAWFALLGAWHPWLPVAALAGLSLQALSMREHPFSLILILTQASLAVIAYEALRLGGAELIVPGAQAFLLVAAALRVVGHASEPLPPMLLERSDRFTSLGDTRFHPRMFLILLAGYVSEFASALPGRLFNVQVYQLALALGYRPRHSSDRAALKSWAERIHRGGWCAHPQTAALFRDVVPEPVSRPAAFPAPKDLAHHEPKNAFAYSGLHFNGTATPLPRESGFFAGELSGS